MFLYHLDVIYRYIDITIINILFNSRKINVNFLIIYVVNIIIVIYIIIQNKIQCKGNVNEF
jgi:hypothetical protein